VADVRPAPEPTAEDEAREDRFRRVLAIATAMLLVSSLACCCLGSALVAATDDGSQTRSRRHAH
jgi:hypothetical protein